MYFDTKGMVQTAIAVMVIGCLTFGLMGLGLGYLLWH